MNKAIKKLIEERELADIANALQIAVEALECYSGLDPYTIASEALQQITAIAEGKFDE